MRRWWNTGGERQGPFEFGDELGREHVFDLVGVAIHVGGCDVGILDEVHFPQAVIAEDPASPPAPMWGESVPPGWICGDVAALHGAAQRSAGRGGQPAAAAE